MASPPLRATPGDWLRWAEGEYARAGAALGQVAADAHDEALYLILHTLGLPLDSEPEVLGKKLSAAERAKLGEVFRRRLVDRVPAAYLTREAWLGEHRFYVDERVIIPRSYFLEIIPGELASLLPSGKKIRRAIDVCTGSGCLAILLAHEFPAAQIDACDLSAAALAVAKINVAAHQVGARVRLFESDVLEAVPPAKYDLILSNPPYEPSAHVDAQAPEFAAEPRMAHDLDRKGRRDSFHCHVIVRWSHAARCEHMIISRTDAAQCFSNPIDFIGNDDNFAQRHPQTAQLANQKGGICIDDLARQDFVADDDQGSTSHVREHISKPAALGMMRRAKLVWPRTRP